MLKFNKCVGPNKRVGKKLLKIKWYKSEEKFDEMVCWGKILLNIIVSVTNKTLKTVFKPIIPLFFENIYTAKIYDAITSLLLHKCCTLNLTTTSLHLIVVYYDLSYSTTTTLQRTVVFITTFLIYFVVVANCRYNYDDLLYTANMYYYATTYLS